MRKQHLDLATLIVGALVLRCLGDPPRHIARGFMDAARDLAIERIRATLLLQCAGPTVARAGSIDDGVVDGDRARCASSAVYARSTLPPGQWYTSASSFHWKSLREKVPSVRSVLSHTGMCHRSGLPRRHR